MKGIATILAVLIACLASAALAAQVTLTDVPRRYLVIEVEGANREWEVRPDWISDRTGGAAVGAGKGDLQRKYQRWERTGQPKRYDTRLWRTAFNRWLGPSAPEGAARFYFYAIEPRQPRVDGAGVLNMVDERRRLYWVQPQKVKVKSYPQTWVDVFEGYVNQFSGEERRNAVKQWEEAHRALVANVENKDEGFSPEERNEFARFYEQQFVYIRDQSPKLASIYDELANFHRARNNLDAELSTYLGALRSGVESPDRERFALSVGRIFVNRLQLHEPAIPHLNTALNFSEARRLLARCLMQSARWQDARAAINDLAAMLETGELNLETTKEEELGLAWLMLAELEFGLQDFPAANAALDRIPAGNASYEPGRVLYCAMLLHRNLPRRGDEKGDFAKVRDVLKAISWWPRALGYGQPTAETIYPLDPLIARALLVYAQTDPQFAQIPRPEKATAPSGDVLSLINAAKALDPLSAEPYLAEFRLYQRLGGFREALSAALAGLDVNPRHVLLNYSVADVNLKAGVPAVAKDYLTRCLKHDPNFYPALVMMAEIALSDIDRIRGALQVRQGAGEKVDYAGELVPPMKEAAAFFGAAVAINPDQPATRLALATLYLRLAEIAPQAIAAEVDRVEVRKAYLSKARDLALDLMRKLDEYANGEKPGTPSEREIAEVPNPACYNVYACALYSLGFHNQAKAAFNDHIARALDKRYFATTQLREEYQRGAALAYAKEWMRRIEENQRQYFDTEEFEVDSKEGFYNNWRIVTAPKPDAGFKGATSMKGGKLVLGVNQQENGVPSRIEMVQPYSTLAAFEAEVVKIGTDTWERGIFISKYKKPSSGVTDTLVGTIMVGIDSENRVYWETREFKPDNAAEPEKRIDFGFIDVGDYGGVPLNASDALKLGIRRQTAVDGSVVEYFALINGHEVRLPLKVSSDVMAKNDIKNADLKAACGFYASAFARSQASTEVERVRFVFDSGLGERKR